MRAGNDRRNRAVVRLAAAFLIASSLQAPGFPALEDITVTQAQAEAIGAMIFRNECAGRDSRLLWWNDGEEFISVGIGHFIWYTEGRRGPFDESFPSLLAFIRDSGRDIPARVASRVSTGCPWRTKAEFLAAVDGPEAGELRTFLAETKDLQLRFMVNRLKTSLPKMLAAVPEDRRPHLTGRFYDLASSTEGLYTLIDYVNFNGEGVLPTERYNGKGWGLAQVLDGMSGDADGSGAVRDFVRSALEVIAERVANSPPERNEKRWLPGWKARLNTYLDFQSRVM